MRRRTKPGVCAPTERAKPQVRRRQGQRTRQAVPFDLQATGLRALGFGPCDLVPFGSAPARPGRSRQPVPRKRRKAAPRRERIPERPARSAKPPAAVPRPADSTARCQSGDRPFSSRVAGMHGYRSQSHCHRVRPPRSTLPLLPSIAAVSVTLRWRSRVRGEPRIAPGIGGRSGAVVPIAWMPRFSSQEVYAAKGASSATPLLRAWTLPGTPPSASQPRCYRQRQCVSNCNSWSVASSGSSLPLITAT